MRKKQDVIETIGTALWHDQYSRAGEEVFRLPKEQIVKYDSLDYDYSETTPQWQERRSKPWIFVPPTNVHTYDVRGFPRKFSLQLDDRRYNTKRTYSGMVHPPIDALRYTGVESSDWTESLLKAQSDLKGMKVNLGEAFLEARQTGNMVLDNLFRLATLAKDLRRGRFHRPFQQGTKIAHDFAELWLEYKYGWLPLLDDVYGAFEIMRDRDKARPYQIMGRGKSKHERVRRQQFLTLNDYTGAECGLWWRGTAQVTSKTKLYFKVDVDMTSLQRETAIDNPALVVWELVPYSFVADWFLPIGTYLNAVGYSDGLVFNGGFTSVVSVVEVLYETEGTSSGTVKVKHSTEENFTAVAAHYHNRKAYVTAPPVPFPAPDPDGLFKGDRIVSAVALLLGLLGGSHSGGVPVIRY